MRTFKDVTLNVNFDKRRSNAVFDKSQIFFSSTKDGLSGTSFLQYCPSGYEAQDNPYNAKVTLPLCENTARFIKLRLYFGGIWLLITEISFNSGIVLFFVNGISIRYIRPAPVHDFPLRHKNLNHLMLTLSVFPRVSLYLINQSCPCFKHYLTH